MSTTPDPTGPAPPYTWDVPRLLDAAGGARGLHEALAAVGPAPTINALWMWRLRGRIPGGWTASVVRALAARGLDPAGFTIPVLAEAPPPPRSRSRRTRRTAPTGDRIFPHRRTRDP